MPLKFDAAPFFPRPGEIEISPDERRTPKGGQNAALPRRLSPDRSADSGTQFRSFRRVFGQSPRDRANEVAIGIAPEDLETRQAAFAKARPVVLNCAPLSLADSRLLLFPVI